MWVPDAAATDAGLKPDDLFKALALLVGGAWTYLNYVRGRTFRRRLEVDLKGKILEAAGVTFFAGECRIKNVGLSKAVILQVGTGLTVSVMRMVQSRDGRQATVSEEIAALPIFVRQEWLEPGETVADPFVVLVPEPERSMLGVHTAVSIANGQSVWYGACFTEKKAKEDGEEEDDGE